MNIFSKRKLSLKTSSSVGITEIGRKEAENYESSGTRFMILSKLAERSPMTIGDLADETGMDIGELKFWINKLFPEYIRVSDV